MSMNEMKREMLCRDKYSREKIVLAVICIIAAFANNSVFVPDIMESRNIVTAREMVYDGHWVLTTMNGSLRLEKPPLPTWFTALAEIASPGSVALMRAMAGAAALLLFYFFYRTARRILHIDAIISTYILATCYSVVLMSHTASWDIYCHAFMMGGIYFLGVALGSGHRKLRYFVGAGIFIGLSIMSKGPVSLFALFLPMLISYIWICRPDMSGKWGGVALTVLAALVVGCWWYGYVWIFHQDALSAVASKETGAWLHRNVRPWYYYWKFFLESGVWSVLLLTALIRPLLLKPKPRGWQIAALWLIISLFLLSLMPEKKTRYLFPILIPASMAMGSMVQMWEKMRQRGRMPVADVILIRINTWLISIAVVAIPILAWKLFYNDGMISASMLAGLVIICLTASAMLIMSGIRRRPQIMVLTVALFFALFEIFYLPLVRPLINNPDMKSIAATKNMPLLRGIDFYSSENEELRIEMVYAAGRKIMTLDFSNTDSLRKALPMVVLTHTGAANELNQEIFSEVDTTYIGHFDDNRRSPESGKYNPTFIYHLTLLKPKSTK